MILKSENVDIKSNARFGHYCLHFVFKGKFTEKASELSTSAWKEEVSKNAGSKYVLVWDCLKMDGFEIGARREWLECMKVLKHSIHSVVVVSDNVVIRGAAYLMLKLFTFESTVVKSFDELA